MKHRSMRDFFYDKNDILLALAIIIIAGLLIWWRMDVIMDYPQSLAEATNTTEEDTKADDAVNDASDKTGDDSKEVSVFTDGKLTKDVKVKINGGSAESAVKCLVDAQLFKDYAEFESICKAAGVKAESIKAATFTFQAGSTQTDIAVQATK